MKTVLVALFFLLIASQSIAGPFGIDKGASAESLDIIKRVSPGVYYVNPPQKHSLFEKYLVMVSDTQGVYKIVASGKNISTNTNGTELTDEFDTLKSMLSKSYGEYLEANFGITGSEWDEPEDFMEGLLKKERLLSATWIEKYGAKLKGGIQSVKLEGTALKSEVGYLSVKYEFDNLDATQKKI